MATPIQIIISVKDAASKPLDDVNKKVKKLGDSAKKSKMDITEFNRSLFAATAVFKTFSSAFTSMFGGMEKGAEFDRVVGQFERVLGPKGELFNNIKGLTDASIDQFEALRSGIQLKSLGIVGNTKELAEVVARAGVAAKLAGMESGEGIKNFTEFLKDGSVAHLEYLNMVARTNPALQAELAILKTSGGVMGDVLTTQEKLMLGKKLLYLATVNQMKGNRDLLDTIKDLSQFTNFLKIEIGTFLGKALQPVLETLTQFIIKIRDGLESLRKNHKDILEVVKVFTILGTVLTGVIATLGVFKGVTAALGSLGFGIPKLTGVLLLSAVAFLGITDKVDGLTKKLELLGQFFKGVGQLFSSFFDPENFEQGIGKIDKRLYDFLNNAGLLTFTRTISRILIVLKTFFSDTLFFIDKTLTRVSGLLGGFGNILVRALDVFKEPWSRFWIDENPKMLDRARRWVTVAGAIVAAFAGFKLIKGIFGGFLSKLPIIGGLFGEKNDGSSRSRPLWVKSVDGIGGIFNKAEGFGNILGGKATDIIAEAIGIKLITSSVGAIWNTIKAIVLSLLPSLIPILGSIIGGYTLGSLYRAVAGIGEDESGISAQQSGTQFPPVIAPMQPRSTIPEPETQSSMMDNLTVQMKDMDAANKLKFITAIDAARMESSDEGKNISKREYNDLLQLGVQLLTQIKSNTDPNKRPIDTSTKRNF